jgi:hypothetical protein
MTRGPQSPGWRGVDKPQAHAYWAERWTVFLVGRKGVKVSSLSLFPFVFIIFFMFYFMLNPFEPKS